MQICLKDDDPIFDDTFACTKTDEKGYFDVTGSARDTIGNPDPFLLVCRESPNERSHFAWKNLQNSRSPKSEKTNFRMHPAKKVFVTTVLVVL